MGNKKITIVIPNLNNRLYLDKAIRSIIHQDYPNKELIVIDGGSKDGSQEIIKRYEDQIDFWISEPDQGQADAIFRGFERSTGEILGWLNSDDYLLPGTFHKVASFFENNPKMDCVIGGCYIVDDRDELLKDSKHRPMYYFGLKQHFYKLLYWETGFCQPASFWRREAFFRVGGFDRDLLFCFDYDLYLRLAREKPFGTIEDFLACFRHHQESKSSRIPEVSDREKVTVKRRHGFFEIPSIVRFFRRRGYVLAESVRKRLVEVKRRKGKIKIPSSQI
jgi:glycosyltransferase involved in cell wall biosynthesis